MTPLLLSVALLQPPPADALGDPLPPGALLRIGTARLRPGAEVVAMTFTADGKKLVTATLASGVHVWEAATGKELHHLPNPPGKVTHVALAPEGATVATLDETGPWLIRDVASGAVRGRIDPLEETPFAARFSPDGKWLVVVNPEGVHFASVDGKAFLRACGPRAPLKIGRGEAAFTPDGRGLVVAPNPGPAGLYDLASGKRLRTFANPQGYEEWGPVAVSADGDRAVASHFEHLHFAVWDLATGKLLKSLKPKQGGPARAVLFSPDARFVICAGPYESVGVWEIGTGKLTRKLPGHLADVALLALAPNGTTLATADTDGGIRLWDWTTGKPLHPPGRWLDGVANVWITADGKYLKTLSHQHQQSIYFPPTGSTYQWWDAATGKPLKQIKTGPDADLSEDGQILVTIRGEKKVVVTNRASKKVLLTVEQSGWPIDLAMLSPDARTVLVVLKDKPDEAISSKHELQLWDLGTGKRLLLCAADRQSLQGAFFSADGRTLFVQEADGAKRLAGFDTATGARVRRPQASIASALLCTLTDDARLVAEVQLDAGTVKLQEAASGQVVRTWQANGVATIAFAPGGRLLAGAMQDGSILLWDAATGRELARLTGHRGGSPQLSWSADGKRLVSFGPEKTVLVWDAAPWWTKANGGTEAAWTAPQQAALLDDLAAPDGVRAFAALEKLVQAPAAAVALLRRELRPAAAADMAQIQAWIADLDSGKFAVRQQAQAALARLGEAAAPALERALANKPTLETHKRVVALLDRVETAPAPPAVLRQLRSLQLLVWIGNEEARALLRELAAGEPGAWLTRDAGAALRRLP